MLLRWQLRRRLPEAVGSVVGRRGVAEAIEAGGLRLQWRGQEVVDACLLGLQGEGLSVARWLRLEWGAGRIRERAPGLLAGEELGLRELRWEACLLRLHELAVAKALLLQLLLRILGEACRLGYHAVELGVPEAGLLRE